MLYVLQRLDICRAQSDVYTTPVVASNILVMNPAYDRNQNRIHMCRSQGIRTYSCLLL
jgi:hypothetical protein